MKRTLILALAASMILSMASISTYAATPIYPTAYTAQARIASNIPLAPSEIINQINSEVQSSIYVPDNNYVAVSYLENGRVLQTLVNTNSAVAGTPYLAGLKGTGFKTSLTNFMSKLVARDIVDYEINGVNRSKTGVVTADEIQNAVMDQMKARLKTVTGSSLSALFAKMKDLAKVGDMPAKMVLEDKITGEKYYIDFVIRFTGSTWAVA